MTEEIKENEVIEETKDTDNEVKEDSEPVNPFVEEKPAEAKEEPLEENEFTFNEKEEKKEPKKKKSLIVILAVLVSIILAAVLVFTQSKGKTYNVTELFETSKEVSITLPKGYLMDNSANIYIEDENGLLNAVGAVAILDCDEETYSEYMAMYRDYYGGTEEVLNNLEVVHLSSTDEETNTWADGYIFYQNGSMYMFSIANADYSTQLKFIDGMK